VRERDRRVRSGSLCNMVTDVLSTHFADASVADQCRQFSNLKAFRLQIRGVSSYVSDDLFGALTWSTSAGHIAEYHLLPASAA
jgi:hypothetical protein